MCQKLILIIPKCLQYLPQTFPHKRWYTKQACNKISLQTINLLLSYINCIKTHEILLLATPCLKIEFLTHLSENII